MGHALNLSLQDTLLRYHKQHGAKISWKPGSDHAGLATHAKICEIAPKFTDHKFGIADPLLSEYQELANAWTKEHQSIIFDQFSTLHPSTTAKPRFTLDAAYQEHALWALSALRNHISWIDGKLTLSLTKGRDELMNAIACGDLTITPRGHGNRLTAMLGEERDWDIGRSIPWGIAIPQWCYDLPGSNRDMLTLDTWFSSSLWPSAMHPGEDTPFDALITGYDILFFWGARMAMMHLQLFNHLPFKKIQLHGLIRDEHGRKFSKSLGNGVDPIEIINKYGSDAARIWCLENAAWGRDIKFKEESLIKCNGLPTKMLNATRWLLSQEPTSATPDTTPDFSFMELDDELNTLMNEFKLDAAMARIKKFAWKEWAEGWMTEHKDAIRNNSSSRDKAISYHRELLARLHPFMPATSSWLLTEM